MLHIFLLLQDYFILNVSLAWKQISYLSQACAFKIETNTHMFITGDEFGHYCSLFLFLYILFIEGSKQDKKV